MPSRDAIHSLQRRLAEARPIGLPTSAELRDDLGRYRYKPETLDQLPLDYAPIADGDEERQPFEARPMFTLTEILFLASLAAVAALGFWMGWPS